MSFLPVFFLSFLIFMAFFLLPWWIFPYDFHVFFSPGLGEIDITWMDNFIIMRYSYSLVILFWISLYLKSPWPRHLSHAQLLSLSRCTFFNPLLSPVSVLIFKFSFWKQHIIGFSISSQSYFIFFCSVLVNFKFISIFNIGGFIFTTSNCFYFPMYSVVFFRIFSCILLISFMLLAFYFI